MNDFTVLAVAIAVTALVAASNIWPPADPEPRWARPVGIGPPDDTPPPPPGPPTLVWLAP